MRQMHESGPANAERKFPVCRVQLGREPSANRRDPTRSCLLRVADMAGSTVVFATVGTTSFSALADTLLTAEVLAALHKQGYRKLVLQIGRGPEPQIPSGAPLQIEWYRFKPSLEPDMRDASLIVSHAGAGSILEGMRLKKLMLVVVNDALMDNHQQELAQELHARKHLLATVPSTLLATLRSMSDAPPALVPLPPADESVFPAFMATTLGLDRSE